MSCCSVLLLVCIARVQAGCAGAGAGCRLVSAAHLGSRDEVEGGALAAEPAGPAYSVQVGLKGRRALVPLRGHVKVDHQRDLWGQGERGACVRHCSLHSDEA